MEYPILYQIKYKTPMVYFKLYGETKISVVESRKRENTEIDHSGDRSVFLILFHQLEFSGAASGNGHAGIKTGNMFKTRDGHILE